MIVALRTFALNFRLVLCARSNQPCETLLRMLRPVTVPFPQTSQRLATIRSRSFVRGGYWQQGAPGAPERAHARAQPVPCAILAQLKSTRDATRDHGDSRAPRSAARTPGTALGRTPAETLGGEDFRRLLQSGTTWLERNATAVDALNVFPVPDGDTGTNMLLTMRAASRGRARRRAAGAGAVLKGAAQGAVMGARGNSGVILSQIVAGIARGVGEHETCDGSLLAAALAEGAATAYRAVTRPVEGTILTVARLAGDGAVGAAGQAPRAAPLTCRFVLERAPARPARRSSAPRSSSPCCARPASSTPAARATGSSWKGWSWPSPARASRRAPPPPPHTGEGARAERSRPAGAGRPGRGRVGLLHPVPDPRRGAGRDAAARGSPGDRRVGPRGRRRVVRPRPRPHRGPGRAAHLRRPLRAPAAHLHRGHGRPARRLAALPGETPEAAEASHADGERPGRSDARRPPPCPWRRSPSPPAPAWPTSSAAWARLEIVPGGQTMNPSAGELLEAARRSGAETVDPAAQQRQRGQHRRARHRHRRGPRIGGPAPRVLVVPTRTVPQGIAAQLAFDPKRRRERERRRHDRRRRRRAHGGGDRGPRAASPSTTSRWGRATSSASWTTRSSPPPASPSRRPPRPSTSPAPARRS